MTKIVHKEMKFNMTLAKLISEGSVRGRVNMLDSSGDFIGRAIFSHSNPYGDVFTIIPNQESGSDWKPYLVCFNKEGKSIGEFDRNKFQLTIKILVASPDGAHNEWIEFLEHNDGVPVGLDFKSICQDLIELHERKNKDYGGAFNKSMSKYGVTALMTRLNDKWERLESLFKNGKAEVADESFEDTLKDLAAYAIMGLEYLSNR